MFLILFLNKIKIINFKREKRERERRHYKEIILKIKILLQKY